MSEQKQLLDDDKFKVLNDVAEAVEAMPEGALKEEKRNKLKAASAKILEQYDVPIEPTGNVFAMAGKYLGYVPSAMLGAVATVGEGIRRQVNPQGEPIITQKEILEGLNPLQETPLPSVATYMERAGVPELGSVDLPILGQVTGRGALGFGGDVATGVALTKGIQKYLASKTFKIPAGASAEESRALVNARKAALAEGTPVTISKKQQLLAALADPFGTGIPGAGRKLYRSTLGTADKEALKKTGQRFSDVAMREGIWGSPEGMKEGISNIATRENVATKNLISNIADKVPDVVIPEQNLFAPGYQNLEAQRIGFRAPEAAKVKAELSSEIVGRRNPNANVTLKPSGEYLQPGETIPPGFSQAPEKFGYKNLAKQTPQPSFLNIEELQKIKQHAYDKAAEAGAFPLSLVKDPEQAALNKVRAGAYSEIGNEAAKNVENIADEARAGLGGDIYKSNRDLNTLLTGQAANIEDKLGRNTYIPNRNPFSPHSLGTLTKNYLEAGTTGAGLAMSNAPPWLTSALRASLNARVVEPNRQRYEMYIQENPWVKMMLQENKK